MANGRSIFDQTESTIKNESGNISENDVINSEKNNNENDQDSQYSQDSIQNLFIKWKQKVIISHGDNKGKCAIKWDDYFNHHDHFDVEEFISEIKERGFYQSHKNSFQLHYYKARFFHILIQCYREAANYSAPSGSWCPNLWSFQDEYKKQNKKNIDLTTVKHAAYELRLNEILHLNSAISGYTEALIINPNDNKAARHLADLLEISTKENIFKAIQLFDWKKVLDLLKQCLDITTIFGQRFWKKEGVFDCKLGSGKLAEICQYLNRYHYEFNLEAFKSNLKIPNTNKSSFFSSAKGNSVNITSRNELSKIKLDL